MALNSQQNVTQYLVEWNEGNPDALDKLMPLVYGELRRLARGYLRRERPGHTLQPTALVHEAFLRLIDQNAVRWQNRAHFFGIAAQMMRRILVNHAVNRRAGKRGGSARKVSLDEATGLAEHRDIDVIALNEALTELEAIDPRQSRVVELRFFGGLSIEESAEVLSLSTATVKREWSTARLWLRRRMSDRGSSAKDDDERTE